MKSKPDEEIGLAFGEPTFVALGNKTLFYPPFGGRCELTVVSASIVMKLVSLYNSAVYIYSI